MRSAIIENGVVVNVIAGNISGSIECAPEVSKGWTYSGGTFTAPVVPEPSAAEVLETEREAMICSRFQAKAALAAAGLLEDAETAVANASDIAKLAWAEAIEFRRNSPTIATLASAVGLTDAQVDDLFRAAMQIEA